MDGWIIVRNWDRFQHYGDRRPVWIKVYLELADSEEWAALSLAQRGLLVSIWVEFCSSRGHLPVRSLSKRVRQKTSERTIKSLVDAGFIDISASEPLALEEKTLKEQTRSVASKRDPEPTPSAPVASLPVTGSEQVVERLIRNGVISDLVDLNAELAGYRINGNAADRLRQLL